MTKLLNIYQKVQGYITLGLLGTTLVASGGWYITGLKLASEVEKVVSAELRYDNLVAEYEATQAEYEAKALREKEERERKDREIAAKNDARYNELLAKYRANLGVYAQTYTYSPNSGDNLSSTASSPTLGDGPGIDPEVFAGGLPDPERASDQYLIISYDDATICLINTARVVSTQEWWREVMESYNGR